MLSKTLALLMIFAGTSANAHEAAPSNEPFVPREVVCAEALATATHQPLIQIKDIEDRIDLWHLSDEARHSLRKDLANPKVVTTVAVLKGQALKSFVDLLDFRLRRLNVAAWAERRRTAPRFNARLPYWRAGALLATTVAIGFSSQHWTAPVAMNLLLLASALEAKAAYHRTEYLRAEPLWTDGHALMRVRHLRNTLSILNLGLNHPTETTQVEAWLSKDTVAALASLNGYRGLAIDRAGKALDRSIEFNRRWGWLDPFLPGRRRVAVTYHVDLDAENVPSLTIVSRIKRW